ncbi:MAG: hypothetical protein IID46_07280 [Planctomycetes bacterium]|nr:hypothetical protein [Planctomycetota bacterium]
MTRVCTAPNGVTKPHSVLFGELAIAAGFVGKPIAVCFAESSAALDCDLWLHLAQIGGPSRVLHVHGKPDIKKLVKFMGAWRLVIVHAPRLHNEVAWIVQMHSSTALPRPAIFSRAVPTAVDDDPIATLVLRSNDDESTAITRWLMSGSPPSAILPDELPVNNVMFSPALNPVMTPRHLPNGRGPRKLRDCKLLAALLSGASLLRSAAQPDEPDNASAVGRDDYELVRRLLQSPLLCTADEPINQLAVDMVGRANVFLKLKLNPELIEGNPLRCSGSDPTWSIRGSRTRQELTTRSEIADLGNVHSRLIHEIIDLLHNMPDDYSMFHSQNTPNGYAMFQRMGLVRRPPNERDFKSSDSRTLAGMLRSWTSKQVRSSFEILYKSGLISGAREHGNGPWQYELPEELSTVSSPFRSLPTASEVFAETGPST